MNFIALAVAVLVVAVIYVRWPYTNGWGPVPQSVKSLRRVLFNKHTNSRN